MEQEIFSFLQNVQAVSGVKRPGLEVDDPPPLSAEFKSEWSYTSAPAVVLHGVDKDEFTVLPVLGYSY